MQPIRINETARELQVRFQFSPWLVKSIKQIPGRKFIGGKKYWSIPISSKRELMTWASPHHYEHVYDEIDMSEQQAPAVYGPIDPLPELNTELKIRSDVKQIFSFQGTGVAYSMQHQQTIIGDEPGLGKTVQAIATMETLERKCILVICPATLRPNWKREIESIWTHKKAMILTDKVRRTWHSFYQHGMVNYFICNFESLKKLFVERIDIPEGETLKRDHITFSDKIKLFDGIIIDELHRCKDGNTQQSKFVMGITRGKPTVLGLTGTAVVNSPKDLVAQLHIINQLMPVFGSYKNFVARYCSKKHSPSLMRELNYLMHQNCFYRRLKSEVLKELPDKLRNVVRCEITNMEEYKKAEDQLERYMRENMNKTAAEIRKSMNGEIMVQIQILKKLSARGKMEYINEHIRGVMDAGEKMVMFAWHTEIVQEIKKAFPFALTITGDDSMDRREANVLKFQNNPACQLIICNIKAGGVGLTLTASSRVGFAEFPWTPADCDQCEDRCHRIGQKDSVEATYFLGHETIDEDIYKIINDKRKIVKDIIGTEDVETNMMDEFINLFKSKVK